MKLRHIVLFGLLLLAPCTARAACTNPTGAERDFAYNPDYHTYQFCDGTSWRIAGQISANSSVPSFGETSIDPGSDSGNNQCLQANNATLAQSETVTSMSIYVITAAGQVTLGIYDATGPSGGPGNLMANTANFTPISGWNTANVITPAYLPAGTYWLANLPNDGGLVYGATGTYAYGTSYYSNACGSDTMMSSTFPAASQETAHWNVYATVSNTCANPTGAERDIKYNTDFHTLQYCNGTSWIPLGAGSGGGGGGCSNPAGVETNIKYNTDFHTYQFCNGTNWVKFSGSSSVPQPTSSDGYFVMSKSTWNGNLGQQAGANAKCLTELTTNTGWKGYVDANARGVLTSGHVHAFMCGDIGCNTGAANTTYYFADANNGGFGGARFTTDGSRDGPNDSANWSAGDHFGGIYQYWTDMTGSSTAWSTVGANNGPPDDCSNASFWNNGTNAYDAPAGTSGASDATRWLSTFAKCNTVQHLICQVDP